MQMTIKQFIKVSTPKQISNEIAYVKTLLAPLYKLMRPNNLYSWIDYDGKLEDDINIEKRIKTLEYKLKLLQG